MKETIFDQVAAAASVLKLDLSSEEFALFAEDQELSESGLEAVQALYPISAKKAADHHSDVIEDESSAHKST